MSILREIDNAEATGTERRLDDEMTDLVPVAMTIIKPTLRRARNPDVRAIQQRSVDLLRSLRVSASSRRTDERA